MPEPAPEPCFKVCWRNNWACCLTVFMLLAVLTGATVLIFTQNHKNVPLSTTTTVSTTTITTTTSTTSTCTTFTSTTTDGGQQKQFSLLLCVLIFGLFHLTWQADPRFQLEFRGIQEYLKKSKYLFILV